MNGIANQHIGCQVNPLLANFQEHTTNVKFYATNQLYIVLPRYHKLTIDYGVRQYNQIDSTTSHNKLTVHYLKTRRS